MISPWHLLFFDKKMTLLCQPLVTWHEMGEAEAAITTGQGTACSLMAEVHDWNPEGWWFKPQRSHDKSRRAVWALVHGPQPPDAPGEIVPCLV